MDRRRALFKNTLTFAAGKLGTKLISFFLVPLYTYALSTEEYGTVDLITAACTVLMPVLTLNISEAVLRFCMDKGADCRNIMRTGLLILAGAAVAGLALIPLCRRIPLLRPYSGLIYACLVTMACSQVLLSYLYGRGKLMAYSLGGMLHTAAGAALNILFLAALGWGIRGYLLAAILANGVTAVYAAALGQVDRAIPNFEIDRPLSRQMIRYSVVLIPNSLLWWIINSSDRMMVSAICGAAANGIYAVSYKIPSMLYLLSEIFVRAWSYEAVTEAGGDEAASHNRMYGRLVQTLTLATAGIFLVIKPFLRLYVAAAYGSAWMYTPYLLMGFLFLSLATFQAVPYTVYKDSLGYLLSGLIGAGANVVLNVVLIPRMGITGAALATCLSYLAVFLFRAIHTRKYIPVRILQPGHLFGFGLIAAMCGALYVEGAAGTGILLGLFGAVVFRSRDLLAALWAGIRRYCHDRNNQTV